MLDQAYTEYVYETLFNRLFMGIGVAVLAYIPIFYFFGSPLTAGLFSIIICFVMPAIYFLNRKSPQPIYKLGFVLLCSFEVYFPVAHFAGPSLGEFYYSSVLITSIILFKEKEIQYLLVSIMSVPIAWLLSSVYKVKLLDLTIDIQIVTYEQFGHMCFVGSMMLNTLLLTVLLRSRHELENHRSIFSQNTKLASLGSLAAGIGHEINNPLTIANGNIFLIEQVLEAEGYQNEKINKYLSKYKLASTRIKKIVDSMKVLSRSSNNYLETVQVTNALTESINLASELYKRHNIELIWNPPEKGYSVQVEVGRFHQVIMNLLSNARDAIIEAPDSSARQVTVSIEQIEQNLAIKVIDTGMGIPAEIQDKVFDSFFTTKEVGTGTGMGLSISHAIIESFGGTLSFESTPGTGTTFIIQLPIAKPIQSVETVA